jgi:predicted RNA-binding Zn-ribbon protein involved in translation (DUF1610 family)
MSLKQPNSMDECLYFTRRELANNGSLFAWVYKKTCPQCKKVKMGKPVEKGKVKIRADYYVCPGCGYQEQETPHEESCMLDIVYRCPKCSFEGETSIPYIRKKTQMFDEEKQKKVSVDAFPFNCGKCNEKILVTKKLK